MSRAKICAISDFFSRFQGGRRYLQKVPFRLIATKIQNEAMVDVLMPSSGPITMLIAFSTRTSEPKAWNQAPLSNLLVIRNVDVILRRLWSILIETLGCGTLTDNVYAGCVRKTHLKERKINHNQKEFRNGQENQIQEIQRASP
jgi:hypothetical protein